MSAPTVPLKDLQRTLSSSRLRGLWRLMEGFRLTYLGASLSLGLAALAKTGTFLLLGHFVDNVLGQEALGRLLPLFAGGLLALALLDGTGSYLSGRLAARTAEGITRIMRNYLFDHIQRLPFSYHDKTSTGDLIQRASSDVDALRRFYADQAIGIGRIVLLFAVNFGALLWLNARLALLSVVVVPLIVIISLFFFRRITKAYEAYQEQDAVLSTTLQENLSGVRVIKAFARQDYEREKFERDNWEKYVRGRRLLIMHSFFWPISDILCGFQQLLGMGIGALMAIDGALSIGGYMSYLGMVVWLIWPMRNLGRLIVQVSTGLVSYGRLVEVIQVQREALSEGACRPAAAVRGEIVFRGVNFSYEEGSPVLRQVSLRCTPGQAVALLGSTGSGKTSLVNLLPRFYDYDGGSITLDGVELREYPREFLRRQIGIVEQEPFLFSRTIRENIRYGVGRDVSDEEVEMAARSAAIHEVILSFPQGYDTLVGEKGVTLSGGQKQRVAIARTLLKDPRILILDDSTSSVDSETEADIRAALETLMRGRTTLIIAHRIQSVMNADQILVFDRGEIVQRGRHDDLVERAGLYRQIYELQARIEVELQEEMGHAGN